MAIQEFNPTQALGIEKDNLVAIAAPTINDDATQL